MSFKVEVVDKSVVDASDVLNILRDLDRFYVPPISSQVDLKDYAKKITQYAEIVFVKTDSDIIGISALYCNDYENYTAFITTIGLSEKYQRKGLGKKLLDKSIELAKAKGMDNIKLEVSLNNRKATKFYQKNGFRIIDNQIRSSGKKNSSHWLKMKRIIE